MQDKTWPILEKNLSDDTYDVMSARDSAPTRKHLEQLGKEFGCIFPEEFLAHSSGKYGGLYVCVKDELWPPVKEFDVGPFWTFLRGLCTFNVTEEIPDFMNLRVISEKFRYDTKLNFVPFMKIIGNSNRYCFDSRGNIYEWDSATNDTTAIEKSFFELLDWELSELEARKNKKLSNYAT